MTETRARWRIRVEGIVQGVGFRPFVHGLAHELGLTGFVGNDASGVFIEAQGPRAALDTLVDAIERHPPTLAVVERVSTQSMPPATGDDGFVIATSRRDAGRADTLIAPDTATCGACLAELFDPTDRRFRYPFINCTNCGPRFTIVRSVPYDRGNTTMAGFPMCAPCREEYADPRDRRYHAQPVCCPDCGPRLTVLDRSAQPVDADPLLVAAAWLREGRVIAVKGLGGYHLAALASDEAAVSTLRARKHREDKPFAVMVTDLEMAHELVAAGDVECELLCSAARPIVLVTRRQDAPVAASVAPGSRRLGVLLPYTPVHHLLLDAVGAPIVLTSGNVSDEPIAYLDDEAVQRLAPIADGFLTSDRPIHMRTDDSVATVVGGRDVLLRRSRGHTPRPITLPVAPPKSVLACGAELKATFCITRGGHAFVSHHIGDLENYETYRSYTEGIAHFGRLLEVRPEVVAHDLHPDYLSTKYALGLDGVELVGVQHHHAHIAACLADNGTATAVIGVAFDGTGYGADGTLWGGEFLVADLCTFDRVGHLTGHPLPGGATAIREPWRMAVAYLADVYGAELPTLDLLLRHARSWPAVASLARSSGRTAAMAPWTTSAGRLFDAVAALCGLRDTVNYEGQAAIELEQAATHEPSTAAYPMRCRSAADGIVLDTDALVRAVVDDVLAGVPTAEVSRRFHRGLAQGVVETVCTVRDRHGLSTVALSGGVFQNVLLVARLVADLEAAGFTVLRHRQVPPNDGGISLGQAAVAAARGRASADAG